MLLFVHKKKTFLLVVVPQLALCQSFGLLEAAVVMRIVVTSNNLVRLSFLSALLRDAGIDCVVLDGYVSAVGGEHRRHSAAVGGGGGG